jgi:hypothetical protein
MKPFIKEKLNLILEAKVEPHFLKRLRERILETHEVTVGYEISGTVGKYKKVGTFQIPPEIKQRCLDAYNAIVMTNFPKDRHFGIKLADIMINPKLVRFYEGFDMSEIIGKTLVLVDEDSKSNGNIVYAIVRHNEAITMFYAKNYVPQTPEKMQVDYIIKDMKNYKPR